MGEPCHKSEFRKSDIFLRQGLDRVFRRAGRPGARHRASACTGRLQKQPHAKAKFRLPGAVARGTEASRG